MRYVDHEECDFLAPHPPDHHHTEPQVALNFLVVVIMSMIVLQVTSIADLLVDVFAAFHAGTHIAAGATAGYTRIHRHHSSFSKLPILG